MIPRFFLYSFFKNLRFADPFLVLFFLDLHLTFSEIGLLLGLQHLVTVLLEFPSGILADQWGRRRATALCFVCYSVAFAGFGLIETQSKIAVIGWLSICLSFFAIGEALRTGSHKAIMLDYLDSTGQSGLATQLIGRTRAVSKYTSASAAACGGLLLSWTRDYSVLFFLSSAAAVSGFLLMLTYPRALEGDAYRRRTQTVVTSSVRVVAPARPMWKRAAVVALFLQSILFESQLKIILKYFTQPFLKSGLATFGIPIVAPAGVSGLASAGAFWVGSYEFLRDILGGIGARASAAVEQACGGRTCALKRIYVAGTVLVLALAASTLLPGWGLIAGVLVLIGLTVLQNMRRPIFVSALNAEIAKSQRASVLSFESVCRAVTVSLLLPLLGLAADHFGLLAVWMTSSSILLVGLALKLNHDSVAVSVPADRSAT